MTWRPAESPGTANSICSRTVVPGSSVGSAYAGGVHAGLMAAAKVCPALSCTLQLRGPYDAPGTEMSRTVARNSRSVYPGGAPSPQSANQKRLTVTTRPPAGTDSPTPPATGRSTGVVGLVVAPDEVLGMMVPTEGPEECAAAAAEPQPPSKLHKPTSTTARKGADTCVGPSLSRSWLERASLRTARSALKR